MPKIVHFEIPADNIDRTKAFYTGLFDWKIEKADGDMEYWMISVDGKECKDAEMCGGIMPRQNPAQPITNYIGVESVEESAEKVEKLGGKIIVPKTAVPDIGYFVVCLDTENNVFGLWEDDLEAKSCCGTGCGCSSTA